MLREANVGEGRKKRISPPTASSVPAITRFGSNAPSPSTVPLVNTHSAHFRKATDYSPVVLA